VQRVEARHQEQQAAVDAEHVEQAAEVDGADHLEQRQQQADAVLAGHPGHQGADAIGGQRHHHLGQLEHSLCQGGKEQDGGAAARPVALRASEGHGEHDHLQYLAIAHGLHRVARHQVAQHAGQGRLLRHGAPFIRTHIGAHARFQQPAHHQADADGDGGGAEIEADGLAGDAVEPLALEQGGEACQDGTEDEGHHQHLDGVDEQDADGLEQQGLLAEAEPQTYPGQHAEQGLQPERATGPDPPGFEDQSMEQHDANVLISVCGGKKGRQCSHPPVRLPHYRQSGAHDQPAGVKKAFCWPISRTLSGLRALIVI
jgi:hypothetical protein